MSECWFTDLCLARNNSEYNNLIIVEGEPGTGKSAFGCSLGQHLNPYFGAKHLVFTKREFYDALENFKGRRVTLMWDECGVYISHRKWLSDEQIRIMQILQSFRYRKMNMIFTLPSAGYMDKVAREMCHFVINLEQRGVGRVYRIVKTPYVSWTFTPFMGIVYSEMPTAFLWNEFVRLHTEHIDEFVIESKEKSIAQGKKEKRKLEKALQPELKHDQLLMIAKASLPQIVNVNRDTDQGLIKMDTLKQVVEASTGVPLAHTKAYSIRREVLEHLHNDNNKVLKDLRKKASREAVSQTTEGK